MHTIYVSPGKDFFVCKNKREDALRDGQPVYRRLPIAWLRLNEKGNAERGGYMRHIYRCFAIQIQPAAAAPAPTGAAEAQPTPTQHGDEHEPTGEETSDTAFEQQHYPNERLERQGYHVGSDLPADVRKYEGGRGVREIEEADSVMATGSDETETTENQAVAEAQFAGSGLKVEGHPLAYYNGVYRVTAEHDGWPVMKNAKGLFCYYYAEKNWWFLWKAFTPEKTTCKAYIAAAADGTMPMGGNDWRYVDETLTWGPKRITTSLVGAPVAQLAVAQFAGSGLKVEGHPLAYYNGVYRVTAEHDGWPVMKNANGRFCYYYAEKNLWFLRTEFTPEKTTCKAYIAAAADGTMPMGGTDWRYVDETLTWGPKRITTSLV
jgi:hypothetical protein